MPISVIGHASANATTVSLPGGTQTGDFAIVTAGRPNTAGPSVPDGTWTDNGVVSAGSGGTAHGQRSGWKRLTPADITAGNVGTWANATEIQVLILRGSIASIADVSGTGTDGTTLSLPARTIAAGSLVVGMGTHVNQIGSALSDATVTDYTTRSTGTTSTRVWCGTGTASAASRSITGLNSTGNVGLTLEVEESIQPPANNNQPLAPAAIKAAHVGFVAAMSLALLSSIPAPAQVPTINWATQRIVTSRPASLPPTWTQNARRDPPTSLVGRAVVGDVPQGNPFPRHLRTFIGFYVFDAVAPSEPFKSVAQPLPWPRRTMSVAWSATAPRPLLTPPGVPPVGCAAVALPPPRPVSWRAPQTVQREPNAVTYRPFSGSAQPLPGRAGAPSVAWALATPRPLLTPPNTPPVGRSAVSELPLGRPFPRQLRTHIGFYVFDAVAPSEPFKSAAPPLPPAPRRALAATWAATTPRPLLTPAPALPVGRASVVLPPARPVSWRAPHVGFVHARPSYYTNPVVVVPTGTIEGLLAATARDEIILCELEPLYTLLGFAAAGGGFSNTYSVSVSRLVETSHVIGGVYAPVIGVTENGVGLTQRASTALVDANAGSWYWDETAGTLYVRPSSGAPSSYTMLAKRRLFFASTPVILDQTEADPTTAVYYQPWLSGEVPQVRRQVEDLLSGLTAFPSGNVSFINGHRAWFGLVASDGQWNWKYSHAMFYLGGTYNGRSLGREDYVPLATMLVEDVAPTETECVFLLQPLRRLTDLELPVTPLFETDYPNLGDGVRGSKKWIGYGRATIKPDLTDTTTSQGVYTIADAAYQTLFAVNNVWAIRKDTGAWTLLTETTHYTKNLTACTVTIVSATYPFADYEIAVDVSGKPDGLGSYLRTYGAIVQDILRTHIGVGVSELDSAAFAQVAIDSTEDIAIWIKSPRSIASILSTSEPEQPSLGRSVMGTLQQTAAGLWTSRIWNPYIDSITTSLRREDLAKFDPKPKLKAVFSTVRVYYGFDHAKGQWSVAEATDASIQYRTGSRDRLELFTYLTDANTARNMAQRYLTLAGGVTVEAEFEERGALLAQLNAGDKLFVTYTPAPTSAGGYESQPFEILDLTVRYAPKVVVSGVLGDLRGLGGRVGRWVGSSAPDWATATAAERLASGFWSDSSGLIDPLDPTTFNRSIWW